MAHRCVRHRRSCPTHHRTRCFDMVEWTWVGFCLQKISESRYIFHRRFSLFLRGTFMTSTLARTTPRKWQTAVFAIANPVQRIIAHAVLTWWSGLGSVFVFTNCSSLVHFSSPLFTFCAGDFYDLNSRSNNFA